MDACRWHSIPALLRDKCHIETVQRLRVAVNAVESRGESSTAADNHVETHNEREKAVQRTAGMYRTATGSRYNNTEEP